MSKEQNMQLSDQAVGALMMALQKSLLEQSDIVPVIKGFKIKNSEVGLMVMNQTVINLKSELKIKLIEIFPKEFKHLTDNDFAELVTIFNSLKPKE